MFWFYLTEPELYLTNFWFKIYVLALRKFLHSLIWVYSSLSKEILIIWTSNSAFHFFICLHNFSTYFKAHSNINTSSKIDLIEHLVIQPFTSLLPSTHPHTYSTRTHESSYIQCPASILWSFMILFIILIGVFTTVYYILFSFYYSFFVYIESLGKIIIPFSSLSP